jgi:hypothetical protein
MSSVCAFRRLAWPTTRRNLSNLDRFDPPAFLEETCLPPLPILLRRAPCQALFFLSNFQMVKPQTVSFAGPRRNAVATFVLRVSPPRFGAAGGASRIDFVGSPKGRRHLDPKTSASQGELYVNRLSLRAHSGRSQQREIENGILGLRTGQSAAGLRAMKFANRFRRP